MQDPATPLVGGLIEGTVPIPMACERAPSHPMRSGAALPAIAHGGDLRLRRARLHLTPMSWGGISSSRSDLALGCDLPGRADQASAQLHFLLPNQIELLVAPGRRPRLSLTTERIPKGRGQVGPFVSRGYGDQREGALAAADRGVAAKTRP